MGPKKYTIDETVFDNVTEESAYWVGNLMADGNISTGRAGNPRIALTFAEIDRGHLVKFGKFLNSTYEILLKIIKVNGKVWSQYTLRVSSKRLAERLNAFGVTPRKSLTAKVVGLEEDRHFWRGVVDGDGYIKNRDGIDGDKLIVVGSYDLMQQFKDFIGRNIIDSVVKIKQDKSIHRLFVYGHTARMLAELLYANCSIALDRKLTKAQFMIAHADNEKLS